MTRASDGEVFRCLAQPTGSGADGPPSLCNGDQFVPVYRLPKVPLFGRSITDVLYRCVGCGALYRAVETSPLVANDRRVEPSGRWVRVE